MTESFEHLDNPETAALLSAAIEGTLDEEGHQRLAELILHDAEVRRAYLRLMNLHGLLHWQQGHATGVQGSEVRVQEKTVPRSAFRIPSFITAAAAAIALAVTVWFLFQPEPRTLNPESSYSLALLSNADGAVWGASSLPPTLGSDLSPGMLNLVAGSAQVMFHTGAVVDLSGPCTFELTAANHGYLHQGMLSAYVPDRARGFTVDFPGVHNANRIVDLGTEFTLRVRDPRTADIWVHEGTVELITSTRRQMLNAGYGLAMIGDALQPLSTPLPLAGRVALDRTVRFDADRITPYAGQDGQNDTRTEFNIHDNGLTVQLIGNAWKRIDLPCEVMADTIIEFQFRTNHPGEIHGIGFDAPGITPSQVYGIVQFFGSEQRGTVPRIAGPESASDWVTVRVPIGKYFTGRFDRLLLANDDDSGAAAESWFRNVRVFTPQHEDDDKDAQPATPTTTPDVKQQTQE